MAGSLANATRVLVVEDNPGDARLIREMLTEGHEAFEIRVADCLSAGLAWLTEDAVSVVLLDLGLPDSQGFDTLRKVRRHAPRVPIIVLTGLNDEELAIAAVRSGAQDYLVKGQVEPAPLARAIRYAIERQRLEERLVRMNRLFSVQSAVNRMIVTARDRQQLFDEACGVLTADGRFRMAWIGLVETETEMVRPVATGGFVNGYLDLISVSTRRVPGDDRGLVHQTILSGRHTVFDDVGQDPRSGPWRDEALARGYRSCAAFPLRVGEKIIGALAVYAEEPACFGEEELRLLDDLADDIAFAIHHVEQEARRKRAEEERLRLITAIEQSGEVVVVTDPDATIRYVNLAFERITGYSAGEVVGRTPRVLKSGKQTPEFYRELWTTIVGGDTWRGHLANRKKDGSLYEEDAVISPVRDAEGKVVNHVKVARDVTRQMELETQLRQAQKMEAVGRLAGGIAHDFNNLLTVIAGYAELVQMNLRSDDLALKQVNEISKAAARAAELTGSLLAFSRKAIIRPRVMNLEPAVRSVERMLQRIIRENIRLELLADERTWNVRTDPGQIEQIILNLVTNARDAMPDGGQLTIELRNAILDEYYAQLHPEVSPGRYALLMVSDTGVGMDEATRAKIFEPFFTTKGEQGTGLGLATVYGIVKQHHGHITCYSEVGKGTTFRVYLPAVDAPIEVARETPVEQMPRGRETILLVDDDASILSMGMYMLARQGYQVLTAESGDDALRVIKEHGGPLDLLLTDVVLPDMSGRDLAERVATSQPGVKVLYTSGYAENIIAHHGILEPGIAFLQKPYRMVSLLRMVRRTLSGSQ